jgi:hypothetical protein
VFPVNAGPEVVGAIKKHHWARQQAQRSLRDVMATWAGWQQHLGRDDAEAYRRFFFRFGTDVASAQALNAAEATKLEAQIRAELTKHNVVKGRQ